MQRDGEFADFYAANYGRTVALVTVVLGTGTRQKTSPRRRSLGHC
jgi:hypothetical protein